MIILALASASRNKLERVAAACQKIVQTVMPAVSFVYKQLT